MRDVLILAVCLGAVMRLVVRSEPREAAAAVGLGARVRRLVLIEAFNPQTHGVAEGRSAASASSSSGSRSSSSATCCALEAALPPAVPACSA